MRFNVAHFNGWITVDHWLVNGWMMVHRFTTQSDSGPTAQKRTEGLVNGWMVNGWLMMFNDG